MLKENLGYRNEVRGGVVKILIYDTGLNSSAVASNIGISPHLLPGLGCTMACPVAAGRTNTAIVRLRLSELFGSR